MDTYDLTLERLERLEDRTVKNTGHGETVEGLGLAEHFLDDYAAIVAARWGDLKPELLRDRYQPLSNHQVALAAITGGYESVMKLEDLSTTLDTLGNLLDNERYGYEVSNWDAIWAAKQEKIEKSRHGRLENRRTALRSLARKKGFGFVRTPQREMKRVGVWLYGILTEGPMFCLDADNILTLTDAAKELSAAIHNRLIGLNPVRLPSKTPPKPWRGPTETIDGFPADLVRSKHKIVHRAISEALKDGRMDTVVASTNAVQDVAWRINEPVKRLVRWAFENGVDIKKFPPVNDMSIKPKSVDMTEDQEKLWKIEATATRELNRSYIGQRQGIIRHLETADWLEGVPFWTPCNLDYRGRLYGLPMFNFQGPDHIRAMFKFASPKPLGEHGLYWLKVHVANCGDFGKVSKKSFDDRVKWCDDNWLLIHDTAKLTKECLDWTHADKPFLFVAACMALQSALTTGMCDIPVSFDGSCSGLQHYAAMTRDEHTARMVNLTPDAAPQDVYQVVADRVKEVVEGHAADPEFTHNEIAKVCLANGIDRKLVKRNVMTFCYSSLAYGMKNQLQTDTMVPLKHKAMADGSAHPYGDDDGFAAAVYLASVVHKSITDTVNLPAIAMKFLQGISTRLAHECKPTIWHTPLGLPVVFYTPKLEREKITLWLRSKGVKRYSSAVIPRFSTEISKEKARSGIAPCFIHSMDANHLHYVVDACIHEGIDDLALVHDSFGCQAGDAERVREIIKEEFAAQYRDHDVLFDILREAAEQLDSGEKLPHMPPKGTYDINAILESDYAFA